jgi:Macrocin-O-methyltransferase (TylF)
MITLPETSKAFDYENDFYLSCSPARIGKFIVHYELFKKISHLPGAIVECGVFKGASFSRFAAFRNLLGNEATQKLIGFDTFGDFPETFFEGDKERRQKFIDEAGMQSITEEQLTHLLEQKVGNNINTELVQGDICLTVPAYVKNNPNLSISFLHLDVDIYEPSVTILEHLYPRLLPGGILLLDDYNKFPGETKAVNDYFKGQNIDIQKFRFTSTGPYFIVKQPDPIVTIERLATMQN